MADQIHPDAPEATGWRELAAVMLVAWMALIAIPIGLGGIGLSWDALNHHIYLGWIADSNRFDQDFLPAGFPGLQFPYLYWPVYKLSQAGATGVWAGVVLATLHLVAVPPLWMITRACIPGRGIFESALRFMGVALAFLSGVILSQFDSTSNDMLAAAPLVWAVALALESAWPTQRRFSPRAMILLSGLLAGVSVACKLSNGPIVILLPLIWLCSGTGVRARILNTALACLAVGGGFALAYGYWGWLLWNHYGNPIYPFYDSAFEPVRQWLGWAR